MNGSLLKFKQNIFLFEAYYFNWLHIKVTFNNILYVGVRTGGSIPPVKWPPDRQREQEYRIRRYTKIVGNWNKDTA